MEEKVLYDAHPAMFRNSPILFIISVILIAAAGIGLIILLIWWLKVLSVKLTVTSERSTLRRGLLSKYTNDVYHSDVRNVQIEQSFFQRLFNVGTVGISSAGQYDVEIRVSGLYNPQEIKDIIDKYRMEKADQS